jgi:hypothetical protein
LNRVKTYHFPFSGPNPVVSSSPNEFTPPGTLSLSAERRIGRKDMPSTPKDLLEALDFITAEAEPEAEVESLHARHVTRVRRTFDDPNIVGVGVSKKVSDGKELDSLCVCFYVVKKLPRKKIAAQHFVPPVIATDRGQAAYTDVKPIGLIVPQVQPLVKRKSIESGFSIGHVKITAGTVGAIVKKGGKRYVLSNSHVLANSGKGKAGDKVVYPGPADGGKVPSDWVAVLREAVPFKKGGAFVNEVDAALAEARPERLADITYNLPKAKKPLATIAPQRDMVVTKRGRTTGTTKGRIIDTDFRFVLNYEGVGQIGFTRQVLCERYTAGGDSGSLVIDVATGKIVGLHFAGANGGSVFNPIQSVMKALGFTFTAD